MLTPSDLHATLGIGMTTAAAAQMLRCAQRTVRRAAHAYGVELPERQARLRTAAEWLAAYQQHGPGLREMGRALSMNRSYIARRLDELGIRPARDAWLERQEAAE